MVEFFHLCGPTEGHAAGPLRIDIRSLRQARRITNPKAQSGSDEPRPPGSGTGASLPLESPRMSRERLRDRGNSRNPVVEQLSTYQKKLRAPSTPLNLE